MKPDARFAAMPPEFWANVRHLGQTLGYTERGGAGRVRVYTLQEIVDGLTNAGLAMHHVVNPDGSPTAFGEQLIAYAAFRADTLNRVVRPNLMDAPAAAELYGELRARLNPTRPVPMNKQKGDKKAPNYLTGLVNMLIEANADGYDFNTDPRALTTVTRDGLPLRTLARRVDGAFPSTVNPVAIWEIKEFYYTTTFGSRVADGVYETMLDGYELQELREAAHVSIEHLLIVDSHFTWWVSGRSYLCRIIDMLHMGFVDEVLFGREVVAELPAIVRQWVAAAEARGDERRAADASAGGGMEGMPR